MTWQKLELTAEVLEGLADELLTDNKFYQAMVAQSRAASYRNHAAGTQIVEVITLLSKDLNDLSAQLYGMQHA